MSITGNWANSYGSTMNLEQFEDGSVAGIYRSSTGSTGVYRVAGYADPTPKSGAGQAVALSIYWRSIAGGPSNPTWHYVSGFSGQLVTVDGTPSLVLLHAMVDSDDTVGVGGMGTYLDKLVYTPVSAEIDAPEHLTKAKNTADPVCGAWETSSGPHLDVDIFGTDPASGMALGSVVPGGCVGMRAIGYTDVTAVTDGLALQSISLSGFDPIDATAWSLAGTLDLQSGVMTLLQMQSHGTAPDNGYAQTTTTQYVLRKGPSV